MSITEKNDFNKRVWSKEFLERFNHLGVEDRYKTLIEGLCEAGFTEIRSTSLSPLSRVVDLTLEGVLIVRLYLVELNTDHVICYRVSLKAHIDNEDTDTIFHLSMDTIWDDIRRVWGRRFL